MYDKQNLGPSCYAAGSKEALRQSSETSANVAATARIYVAIAAALSCWVWQQTQFVGLFAVKPMCKEA